MKKRFVVIGSLIVALVAAVYGQTIVANIFRLTGVTVAGLPSASTAPYGLAMVTNGNSAGDCTMGGGSFVVFCWSNGTVWASVGAGGGGGGSPFAPNVWPFGGLNASVVTSPLGTANKVHYWSVSVPAPGWTLTYINVYVNTGAGNIAFGLFDSSCNRLGTTNTLNAPGSGPKRFTFSPALTLTPGFYYIAFTADNTSDKFAGPGVSYFGDLSNAGGSSSDYSVFIGANDSTGTTTLTMPATCGTRTSLTSSVVGPPAIFLH